MTASSFMHLSTSPRPVPRHESPHYLLHFESLFHAGRGLSFPCDACGQVPLDELSDQARENYLFARAVVGHEFASPVVRACG